MRDFSRHAVLPMCTGWYGDAAELFVDLLSHERKGYQRFLPADIKYYFSSITERSMQ
jgi:hypothetical protein